MDLNGKIDVIYQKTIKMFDLAKYYLEIAFQSYNSSSDSSIEIDDDVIDKYEREIEELCLSIILKERPFASDLRIVTGIFKLCEDIERLSDHSEDIYWCVSNLRKSSPLFYKINTLDAMIESAFDMLNGAYDSFVKSDDKIAIDVLKKDDIVDALYLEVLDKISELSNKEDNKSNSIIYLTLIAKYVERIADHASNIAEWALYIKSGYYKDKMII